MKVTVIAVGATTSAYLREGIAEYLKRLRHYIDVELIELPDIRNSRSLTPEAQKSAEGALILKQLRGGDAVILLDEHGKEYTSVEFSDMLRKKMASGIKRLVMIIGGPYGFAPEVKAASTGMVSLSRMTFTHEMVRLFFIEQIYRAMTILRGEPYHHV